MVNLSLFSIILSLTSERLNHKGLIEQFYILESGYKWVLWARRFTRSHFLTGVWTECAGQSQNLCVYSLLLNLLLAGGRCLESVWTLDGISHWEWKISRAADVRCCGDVICGPLIVPPLRTSRATHSQYANTIATQLCTPLSLSREVWTLSAVFNVVKVTSLLTGGFIQSVTARPCNYWQTFTLSLKEGLQCFFSFKYLFVKLY